jgi:hypothetical protein
MSDDRQKYEERKRREAERQAAQSLAGRGVVIPPVKHPKLRAKALKDSFFFLSRYFPQRFYLGFGAPHVAAVETIEACITDGGLHALTLMRGGGKTTLAEAMILRALVYGMRRYVVFIGATDQLAKQGVKRIRQELERNDLLMEDFPEVCAPLRALEGIYQRTKGQVLAKDGKPTGIEINDDNFVLPTVAGSKASGSVIQSFGLTGAIRGLQRLAPDGTPIRPDLVLIDDPQTRESAKSPTQTDDRERTINADILGLAGPQTRIASVFLCTPIYPNDLTERFVSRDRHPEWEGRRTRMVETMPERMDLWDQYAEIRRESMRAGNKGVAANEFYAENRAEMEKGCKLSWPEYCKPGDLSGVQTAMNLKIDNPTGFASEYQCSPEEARLASGAKELRPADLAARVSGVPQLEAPVTCTRLTAFVDVGGELLWYAVCAWNESFGGSIIDYGAWPRQGRTMFAANDPRPGMSDAYPGRTEAQRVFAGLSDLLPLILGRRYRRAHGGEELQVERCLIDAGWQTDAVFQAITASPLSASLYASKGVGRSTTQVGVARWRSRPGERSGHHWRLTLGEAKRGRQVQFDPDAWKSVIYNALTVPLGGSTGLSLFGKSAGPHEMLSEHLAAEYSEPAMLKGDTFDKWQLRPDRSDNHLLDCVVGCAVAASVCGLLIPTGDQPAKVELPPKPIKLSELQKQKQQQQGARR